MHEVRLESLAFGGDAVGRLAGKAIFVPFGVPGDRVLVRVVEQHASFVRGELVEVIDPGAGRRDALCEHFGQCGGCQWQHLRYADQVQAKAAVLREQLSAHVCELLPFVSAPAELQYRRRVRVFWRSRGADVTMGFFRRRSRELLDVSRCPLLSPRLEQALSACRGALGAIPDGEGTLAVLEGARGEVHVSLRVKRGSSFDPRLLAVGPAVGARVEGCGSVQRHGSGAVDLAGEGRPPLWASAAAFAQANAAQEEVLRARVGGWARAEGRRVLELFAGIGTLTGVLVDAGELVAVESGAEACALLRRNAAAWGSPVRVREEEAGLALRALRDQRFDLVVLDPPREGCRGLLCELVGLGQEQMIYVSCDPMTLRRDLRLFAEAGFTAVRAQGQDMMPQTYHIEVVVLLRRTAQVRARESQR